jgi:hypothetical protein
MARQYSIVASEVWREASLKATRTRSTPIDELDNDMLYAAVGLNDLEPDVLDLIHVVHQMLCLGLKVRLPSLAHGKSHCSSTRSQPWKVHT